MTIGDQLREVISANQGRIKLAKWVALLVGFVAEGISPAVKSGRGSDHARPD